MLPSRYVSNQASALRKSRLEGKPSLLPKPRRPGSIDRLSSEARRPSNAGHRSSSAEPRGTFGPGRLSREASATKTQMGGRSKSQQSERFGQSSMTPLRSSHFSRPTTTPVRTPSEDRSSRSWQTSLERALAFVTIKDQRPISNPAWQRSECARVQEALGGRGGAGGAAGAGAAARGAGLVRPLTIARFVDIAASLLTAITRDAKLNNDNYVTKLPHLCKRLLYPGAVSKSWLKTVNTLHAFPHALALLAYLLDLVTHIEMPVSDEWLYVGKDELACLRREYLYKCWIRFQDPGHQFEDLNEEYLENLKLLLGNDEQKIIELKQIINKYEACLADAVEAAARAEECARAARRDLARDELRAARAARRDTRTAAADAQHRARTLVHSAGILDRDTQRAQAESQQLKEELEEQTMTVAERARLLDEVDYTLRVQDSKRTLAKQIEKMLLSKETELAQWQKKTLDSCVEYKQGLIHLSADFPDLAALAIDEKELMESECGVAVSRAVEALRQQAAELAARRGRGLRDRDRALRRRAHDLESTRAKISELKVNVQREQQALEEEAAREVGAAAGWAASRNQLLEARDQLLQLAHRYSQADSDLRFWEEQHQTWCAKLTSLKEYIQMQREDTKRMLELAREKRAKLLISKVQEWEQKISQ